MPYTVFSIFAILIAILISALVIATIVAVCAHLQKRKAVLTDAEAAHTDIVTVPAPRKELEMTHLPPLSMPPSAAASSAPVSPMSSRRDSLECPRPSQPTSWSTTSKAARSGEFTEVDLADGPKVPGPEKPALTVGGLIDQMSGEDGRKTFRM